MPLTFALPTLRPALTATVLAAAAAATPAWAALDLNPAALSAATSTGAEARLKFDDRGWDLLLSAGNGQGQALTANLADGASELYRQWWDLRLSFHAGSDLLSWTVSNAAGAVQTLQIAEPDAFNALRIELRSSQPGNQLQWQNLTFSGLTASGALQAEGAVSHAASTQWVVGSGADALGLNDWVLSGRVQVDQGHELTRVTIGTFNVSVVPEPGAAALWLAGLGALGFLRRRRPG